MLNGMLNRIVDYVKWRNNFLFDESNKNGVCTVLQIECRSHQLPISRHRLTLCKRTQSFAGNYQKNLFSEKLENLNDYYFFEFYFHFDFFFLYLFSFETLYRFTQMNLYHSTHVSEAKIVQVTPPLRCCIHSHAAWRMRQEYDYFFFFCSASAAAAAVHLTVCAFWSDKW